MNIELLLRHLSPKYVALAALALFACTLLLISVASSPAPAIDLEFGDTTIDMSADRAWTFFPGDCVTIRWELEGIESLYIDGGGEIGWGEQSFCPAVNSTSPLIEVTAQSGIYRVLELEIHHLPDLLFYLFGFVGLTGSCLLAGWYLWTKYVSRPMPLSSLVVGALILAVVGGWLRLSSTELPVIDEDNGTVSVRFWAERDRLIFPHECANLRWSVAGAEQLFVNGSDYSHSIRIGKTKHCAGDGEGATLEAVTESGERYGFTLPIASFFSAFGSQPIFLYWSLFGIFLAVVIFVPLFAGNLRERWRKKARGDFAAVGGCLFLVFMLYLPFGFDSAGHWEEWVINAYFEGSVESFIASESISRFWVLVPHSLAYLISSESFIGYHLVHFALFVGKLVVLYGILRQLKISPLYPFLVAILFMVYPVNSALMSLRSLPMNFSMLSLLVATYLVLDYIRNPRRLALLGVWLALIFNVSSNESGYALILVVPLLWWLRSRRWSWDNLNLTLIWYLAPAFKVFYLLLMLLTNRGFYQSRLLAEPLSAQETGLNVFDTFMQVTSRVYSYTFVDSWMEALDALRQSTWWSFVIITIVGIGSIAWYLARRDSSGVISLRQIGAALLSGLLFIVPAVGVLMWFAFYRDNLWRMYFYVPIGAAVVLFSVILLVVVPIRQLRFRQAAVIIICLLFMLPGITRLFMQHDQFVQISKLKSGILYKVVETAPSILPKAQILIMTDLDAQALQDKGVFDFVHSSLVHSAFHLLYQDQRPESSYFCSVTPVCDLPDMGYMFFGFDMPEELLQRTLVFWLNEDLSVELIEDPAPLLGFDQDIQYDASQLYDADAPLPSRATTMLGAALRD